MGDRRRRLGIRGLQVREVSSLSVFFFGSGGGPAVAVVAAEEAVGIGMVGALQVATVPGEGFTGEPNGHRTEENGFGHGTGHGEFGAGTSAVEAAVEEFVVMVTVLESGTGVGGEAVFGEEDGAATGGMEEGAVGADDHGGFGGVLVEVGGEQGADFGGGIEGAIEPFESEGLATGGGGGGEGPSDVIGLGPGIGTAFGGLLPGFLDLGGDGEGGLEFEAFPEGVEDMAADIAGPAGAEVLPGAPFDRVIDVGGERAFGCGAEPEVPIQVGRCGLGCGGAGAEEAVVFDGAGSVGTEVGVLDGADGAGTEEGDGGAIADAGGHLGTELSDHAVTDGGLGEGADLGHVMAHGLLAIDVFAAADGGQGDGAVVVVGNGDIDGIDVGAFAVEEFPPIGVGAGFGKGCGGSLEGLGIDIAEGDDAGAGMALELLEIDPPHAADADAGVLEAAIGGGGAEGVMGEERSEGGGGGGLTEELAAMGAMGSLHGDAVWNDGIHA